MKAADAAKRVTVSKGLLAFGGSRAEPWPFTALPWSAGPMQMLLIIQLLFLLTLANGAPVIARKILGNRFAAPLDGGLVLPDGHPLFGASKTIRGIVAAVLATAAGAQLIGLGWQTGCLAGAAAMVGDLFSSFCKRRMDLPPSSRATGLDQIPESLFPLLACRLVLPVTVADIVACVVIFLVGEILLSRILYRLHVRERPY
ncbi:CDP-archaeol synthase [Limobrevibacterium gyesilva]|uniref:CDP-archaeol synthase n=1 Tax=Limobrevibacterium gyesilva TaxID=2991712 RepID=UPI002226CBDE|nr:CDP-archaeol synthase [Limobrevibacterium gyesilva]